MRASLLSAGNGYLGEQYSIPYQRLDDQFVRDEGPCVAQSPMLAPVRHSFQLLFAIIRPDSRNSQARQTSLYSSQFKLQRKTTICVKENSIYISVSRHTELQTNALTKERLIPEPTPTPFPSATPRSHFPQHHPTPPQRPSALHTSA